MAICIDALTCYMNLMYTTISPEPFDLQQTEGQYGLPLFSPKSGCCYPSINTSKDKSWRRKGAKNHGFIYLLFIFFYILYGLADGKTMLCGGVLGEK